MKVLVACEESQKTCVAFRKLGIEAHSCDLIEPSGGHPEWHIQGDAIEEAYSGKYDLMIAHPPCTYLSKAGARWMHQGGKINEERYQKMLEARKFFLDLLNAPPKFKVIENPLPLKIANLPPHSQIIQPYEFGHPYSKKTLLWIRNLPFLKPTKILTEYKPYLPSNTGGKKRGQAYHYVSISKKKASETFDGIATAFAEQYARFLKNDITIDEWNEMSLDEIMKLPI